VPCVFLQREKDVLSTSGILGGLGIIFKWDTFAQTILQNLPLDPVEKERTLAFIIQSAGSIIAQRDAWIGIVYQLR
jgi:hypothetical protein